jgi:hypothetical protein
MGAILAYMGGTVRSIGARFSGMQYIPRYNIARHFRNLPRLNLIVEDAAVMGARNLTEAIKNVSPG